jgi:uncharacterized protein YqgC (DUF456 family)
MTNFCIGFVVGGVVGIFFSVAAMGLILGDSDGWD